MASEISRGPEFRVMPRRAWVFFDIFRFFLYREHIFCRLVSKIKSILALICNTGQSNRSGGSVTLIRPFRFRFCLSLSSYSYSIYWDLQLTTIVDQGTTPLTHSHCPHSLFHWSFVGNRRDNLWRHFVVVFWLCESAYTYHNHSSSTAWAMENKAFLLPCIRRPKLDRYLIG